MKNKKKTDLLRNLVSRSIPVFPGFGSKDVPSDQYIVDGPALRELLRAYRWNYKTVRKHKDWVPTFTLNHPEEPKHKFLRECENADSDDPAARAIWSGVGFIIILSYLLYHAFLKG